MCAPAIPILMGVGAAIQIGGAILEHVEQQKAHDANKEAADESAMNSLRLLGLRQQQEQEAMKQTIYQMDLEARRADAQQRVSAGESGVAGASIDILIRDVERQRLLAKGIAEKNQQNADMQTAEERKGVMAQREARINAVPEPSVAGTALKVGGAVVGAASNFVGVLGDASLGGSTGSTAQALEGTAQRKARIDAEYSYYSQRMRQRGLIK